MSITSPIHAYYHNMDTVISYIRVSTASQSRSGFGLDAQRACYRCVSSDAQRRRRNWNSGHSSAPPWQPPAKAKARIVVAKLCRLWLQILIERELAARAKNPEPEPVVKPQRGKRP